MFATQVIGFVAATLTCDSGVAQASRPVLAPQARFPENESHPVQSGAAGGRANL
jgi:hypothetical protein